MSNFPPPKELSPLTLQKVNVVLAEKRTALTTLRTGIAVCVFPLTITTFLIAFTDHYSIPITKPMPVVVLIMCAIFFLFGLVLLRNGLSRMLFHDRLLSQFISEYPELAELFYKRRA